MMGFYDVYDVNQRTLEPVSLGLINRFEGPVGTFRVSEGPRPWAPSRRHFVE